MRKLSVFNSLTLDGVALRLVDAKPTTTGGIIATYQPEGASR